MGHDPGGFRLWWRQLTGSDATLDNTHVAEDYLARTTTSTGSSQLVGLVLLFCTLNQLNKRFDMYPLDVGHLLRPTSAQSN